jgi:hypothetical protein
MAFLDFFDQRKIHLIYVRFGEGRGIYGWISVRREPFVESGLKRILPGTFHPLVLRSYTDSNL